MKNTNTLMTQARLILLLLVSILSNGPLYSQTDTLHLVYHHTQLKAHDSTLAKIDAWVKKLNGKHVDIDVVAYYHKPEFRKFSQERADEMFLILNRKARSLITIQFIGPKKGKDSQRTTVDIIYKQTLSPEEAAKIAAKEKAEAEAAKAEEKKKKDEEKMAKEAEKKTTSKDSEDKKKSKSEVAAEQLDKEGNKKEGDKKGKDSDKKGKGNKEEDEDDADYGQASSRTLNEGATMTLEEVKYIKSAKFIVAQTGRKSIDTKLNDAVKEFWNFNRNVVQMPYDEARKLGKENKKDTIVIFSFIQVRTWFTEKHGPVTLKVLRIGYALSIETGKGKILVKQFVPKIKGQEPTYIHFVFGVTCLNDLCKIMDENKLTKSGKADEFIDLRTPELKNKTLYLAESQINKNLPHQEIPAYYSAPYNIVPDKVWEDAILQKKDVAYAMVVLFPMNPKHFFHYIIDAKTGKTYFIDLNAKFSVSMGWGTPDFDPTQSGYVDKANFQRYDKGINKAIEDNQERAEDKAKDAEKAKEKEAKKEKAAQAKKEKEAADADKKAKKEEEKKKGKEKESEIKKE